MQLPTVTKRLMLSFSLLVPLIAPIGTNAQIVPAQDGTGTTTQQNQNQINISGGQISKDGNNLFHSFSQFSVNTNQIATFLSTPNIQNILSRVNGGSASFINGMLQVTGGNSNLFLMNPSGIVFGSNASLNLPASFTATTATGINFGSGQFKAIGSNDYANLISNPTSFTFGLSQPGAIVNDGKLSVSSGQNIDLIGGTVISTGTVSAPNGNINIAAVPGTSLVRISQPGNVLSLEISATATETNFTPVTLPALLTGSGIQGVTINGNNVTFDRGNIPINTGDAVVNKLNAGTSTVTANNNLNLIGSNLQTTGDLTLRAQNTAVIKDTAQYPLNITVDGQLLIQGDGKIDIFALNNPNTNISAIGDLTLRSSTTVGGDAHFGTGGNFKIEQLDGKLGSLFSPYDPIIRASGDVSFANYTGASLHILAGGSVNIPGTITITGPDTSTTTSSGGSFGPGTSTNNGLTENFTLADGTQISIDGTTIPTLDIRAGTTAFGTTGIQQDSTNPVPTSLLTNGTATGSAITVGNINFNSSSSSSSSTPPVVLLTNQYAPNSNLAAGDIKTGSITTLQTSISGGTSGSSFTSITNSGDITIVGRKNVEVTQLTTGIASSSIASGSVNTGNITIKAIGDIIATGLITTENPNAGTTRSGNVALTSTNGKVTTEGITTQRNNGNSSSPLGSTGNIDINAAGAISTKVLNTTSISSTAGNSGNIKLVSSNDSIDTGDISTEGDTLNGQSTKSGGSVEVTAKNNITTGNIITIGDLNGGNVILNSGNDTKAGLIITVGNNGGNVTLNSGNDAEVGSIIAGGTNNGGAINITTGHFFRAINTLSDFNAFSSQNATTFGNSFPGSFASSIYSSGNTASGAITIRHAGNGLTPFIVGNATTNGTKGSIVSSSTNSINPTQSFLASNTQGNIQIITGTQPTVTPTPQPQCPPTCPPKGPTIVEKPKPETTVTKDNPDQIATNDFPDLQASNQENAQETLRKIEQSTGVKPALIYARFAPSNIDLALSKDVNHISNLARDNFKLELIMVTSNGATVRKTVPITREKLLKIVKQFRQEVTDANEPTAFLPTAKQLYQWLIAPLANELKTQKIQNLVFIMDGGLRGLPMAALHDGKQFLVERYSVGSMPSLSLTDTRYVDIRKAQVLAMGAENIPTQTPLAAVPIELSTIAGTIWSGKSFQNEQFTASNLVSQRQKQPFGILHLATHGEFKPGIKNSYIQLWDERLQLDRLRQLKLNDPPVELMVLSACRTALGDEEAELGFAGLANRAGVKSAMGSLWYVSDQGTLGLMTSFYRDLRTAPIKAEALRQAQVAMLQGKVRIQSGKLITAADSIDLPPALAKLGDANLTHPFYWAGFTIVGNPW